MVKDRTPLRPFRIWPPVLLFFLIHQSEEVIFSLGAWRGTVALPDWAAFTDRSLMYALDSRLYTALFVAAQCLALLILAFVLRHNLAASRLAATLLLATLLLAFLLHILLSLATHSWMPGVYTSLFPGLPLGAYLLYRLWHNPHATPEVTFQPEGP